VNSSELLTFKDENQPPGDQEPNLHSIKGFRHSNCIPKNINNVVFALKTLFYITIRQEVDRGRFF